MSENGSIQNQDKSGRIHESPLWLLSESDTETDTDRPITMPKSKNEFLQAIVLKQ